MNTESEQLSKWRRTEDQYGMANFVLVCPFCGYTRTATTMAHYVQLDEDYPTEVYTCYNCDRGADGKLDITFRREYSHGGYFSDDDPVWRGSWTSEFIVGPCHPYRDGDAYSHYSLYEHDPYRPIVRAKVTVYSQKFMPFKSQRRGRPSRYSIMLYTDNYLGHRVDIESGRCSSLAKLTEHLRDRDFSVEINSFIKEFYNKDRACCVWVWTRDEDGDKATKWMPLLSAFYRIDFNALTGLGTGRYLVGYYQYQGADKVCLTKYNIVGTSGTGGSPDSSDKVDLWI